MSGSSSGFGCAFSAVLVLGIVVGLGWAIVESDRSPQEIWTRMTGSEPEPPTTAGNPHDLPPAEPKNGTQTDPKNGTPTSPNGTDPAPTYTPATMLDFRTRIERALFQGRLAAAKKTTGEVQEEKVPAGDRKWYSQTQRKIETFMALVKLTDDGKILPMPALVDITLPSGTVKSVHVIDQTNRKITFEEFSGARVGLNPAQLRGTPQPLDPDTCRLTILSELIKRAQKRRIDVRSLYKGTDRGYAVSAAAGGSPTPMDYFDLADFASHWGLAAAVTPLFERASADNPGIIGSVSEVKARRLIRLFLYYLSMDRKDEARRLLKLINDRFARTEAFRELTDGQIARVFKDATGTDIKEDAPELARTGPPPNPNPTRVNPPTEVKTDSKDIEEARSLVRKGDAAFKTGMDHVKKANPHTNPQADEENYKALRRFQEARGYFDEAQEIYSNAEVPIPRSLMEKLRRATQELFLSRKRAI